MLDKRHQKIIYTVFTFTLFTLFFESQHTVSTPMCRVRTHEYQNTVFRIQLVYHFALKAFSVFRLRLVLPV